MTTLNLERIKDNYTNAFLVFVYVILNFYYPVEGLDFYHIADNSRNIRSRAKNNKVTLLFC